MIVQKLKVTNWKHLNGEKDVKINPGFNILVGPNFIGKTSLLEALQYALTGTLPAYKAKEKDKNWIHIATARSDVEVLFQHDQKDYVIRRSIKNRVTKGDVTEELLLIDQGKEISLARGGDVNKKIKEFLPWDDYSVNKIAFMSDDIVNEINKGQKDLFKALKEVLSFKELQEYAVKIKSDINTLSKEKDSLAKKILEFSTQSGDINKEMSELEKEELKKRKDVSDKQNNYDRLKTEKEKVIAGKNKQEVIEKKKIELQNFLSSSDYKTEVDFDKKITELKNEVKTHDTDWLKLKEEYDFRKGRMDMLNNVLKLLESPEEEECPICNKLITSDEKASLLHNHKATKEKNEQNQVERQKELQVLATMKKEKEQLIQQLTNQKKNLETLQADLQQLTQGYDAKTNFRERYEQMKTEIQKAEEELNAEKKLYTEVSAKILKLKAELEFQTNKVPEQLKKVTKEYHRKNLIKDVLERTENDFIVKMIESIKTELESTWSTIQSEAISFDIGTQKGLDFKVARDKKELKIIELSGSERKMLVLLIALLLNKTFFNYPILTIDEPFEPLDSINNEKLQKIFLNLSKESQIVCTTVKGISSIISDPTNKNPINIIDLEKEWKI